MMHFNVIEDRFIFLLISLIVVHMTGSVIKELKSYRRDFRTEESSFIRKIIDSRYVKMAIYQMEMMIVLMCIGIYIIGNNTYNDEDISVKIENVAQDLEKTSVELSNIQEELEERIKFVEELKEEAEIAENVISLTDEQVNAVQIKLNQELEASSVKGLIQNILVSMVFFVLGLIVQPYLDKVKKRLENKDSSNL